MELTNLSALELKRLITGKEVKVREVVEAHLQQIESTEEKIQALLYINGEQALEEAKEMDQRGPEENKPLWGIPVIIKDVLTTKDIPTTCASNILKNFVPFYDAESVARIKKAGGILLAKSNMDEFAMGSSTENSAFKITKNPWDLSRVPGGSSGGSAAAVAAGQAPVSLGSDTGGSIRQPASFCGVVGMKPTYGRVSRFGLIAYGSSLDQVGPITRTVKDCALLLQVIAGWDRKDSTSSPRPVEDYLSLLDSPLDFKGLKIGIPKEYWEEKGIDEEVEEVSQSFLNLLKKIGLNIVPISLPHTSYAIASYYIIVMAEASSNLARYDGVRYGFRTPNPRDLLEMYVESRSRGLGPEVQRRIILGTYVLSAGYYDAYYRKAAQVRRIIRDDFIKAFEKCHLICAPVSPIVPFKIGEKIDDPLQMYLIDIFTTPLNLAGLPGISLPVGFGKKTKMPIGIQFIGPPFEEGSILHLAHYIEKHLPPLSIPRGIRP